MSRLGLLLLLALPIERAVPSRPAALPDPSGWDARHYTVRLADAKLGPIGGDEVELHFWSSAK